MPFGLIIITVLALDQGLKLVVQRNMELNQSIPIIENIFHLTYVLNPGAAFGIFANQTIFFILATLIVLGFIGFYYFRTPREKIWLRVGLVLLVGGALGNLIDRVRTGHVVDFLDFRIWPVFNIADIAISVGVGLLILDLFFSPDWQKND